MSGWHREGVPPGKGAIEFCRLFKYKGGMKVEKFERRIASYFERYEMTLQILRSLCDQMIAPQDIILLACARIDSLANHAVPPGRVSQAEKFVKFLLMHSGHSQILERVSLPDLYASVLVEWWLLPGVVDRPGRLQMFDQIRQREFVEMYWKSGLPLTEEDLEGVMALIAGEIRRRYRVIPYQSRTKPQCDAISVVQAALSGIAAAHRSGLYVAGVAAFKPIIQAHQLAALLYREYRNGSIHGGGVDVDEEMFFEAAKPHWSLMHYEFASSKPIFQVHFPARFLLSVYENCFRGYQKQLLVTQKLPSSIFDAIFPGSGTRHLSYLDQRSIEEAVQLRPRLDR